MDTAAFKKWSHMNDFLIDFENSYLSEWDSSKEQHPRGKQRFLHEAWAEMMKRACHNHSDVTWTQYCHWVSDGGGDEWFQEPEAGKVITLRDRSRSPRRRIDDLHESLVDRYENMKRERDDMTRKFEDMKRERDSTIVERDTALNIESSRAKMCDQLRKQRDDAMSLVDDLQMRNCALKGECDMLKRECDTMKELRDSALRMRDMYRESFRESFGGR